MKAFIGRWWENDAVYFSFLNLASQYECNEIFAISKKGDVVENRLKTGAQITCATSTLKQILCMFKYRKEKILVPDVFSCILLSFFGFHCVFWVQGALSDESLLRNRSKVRYWLLRTIEFVAFQFARELVFVSPYMAEFYNERYNLTDKQSITPCLSDLSYNGDEKLKNSFCYTGGVSEWQKIDWMLTMFNEIIEVRSNATLHIATGNPEVFNVTAKKYLTNKAYNATNICNISSRSKMESFLSKFEYGFLLREECVVNNVSSPIKLAEYLSCGVNVIMTSSIKSYYPIVKSYNAGVVLGSPKHFKVSQLCFNLENALSAYKVVTSIAEKKVKN
jgi:hypothetical protein